MPIRSCRAVALLGLFCALAAARPVVAGEPARIAVTLKDHVFTPSEIVVPAGKPVILVVTNQDAEPEEFDSSALKVEKVIAAKSYATIRLRPLGPGRYPFMGEFHPDRAQGVVVAQ
ncbi:MAG TPA: cupredoxin domain-containing protein [Acetobacteraceae bacterium]|jgi:Cupredoxin-like domain|nr:cupredoxin domain-containing protein [Acetobacteraceae bacterium]